METLATVVHLHLFGIAFLPGSIWVLCVFNWTRGFRIIEYFKLDGAHKDLQAQLHQTSAGETIVLEPLENHQENCS